MTPGEAIGYACATLIVSPIALGILILALSAALVTLVAFLESRKAQVAALVVAALWFMVPPFFRWAKAPKVTESCDERCDILGQSPTGRLVCLEQCFKAEKLIRDNQEVSQ